MGIVRYQVNGTIFEVDEDCYILQHAIGAGAYGTVCSALDVRTQEKVAIKKVTNAFVDVDTRRILREIKLLRHFKHDNIIGIRDILKPPSKEEFKDIYIVTDLMDTDLHQIIKSDQVLTDAHVQYFMYQILRGLKCIHSANVLHRDLKPSNILLNANCDLKICDFGLARGETQYDKTDYVATRWYRAPELLMQWTKYDKAIDIWSVGCIFCELLGRKPLFPGRNYIDQLHKILDLTGTPDLNDYKGLGSEQAQRYVQNLAHRPRVPLALKYPNANPLAIDLIEKMLSFNPAHRPTVEESLQHPYFAAMHDPRDEPICEVPFDYTYEKRVKSRADIKELIYEEMLQFHPELLNDGHGGAHNGGTTTATIQQTASMSMDQEGEFTDDLDDDVFVDDENEGHAYLAEQERGTINNNNNGSSTPVNLSNINNFRRPSSSSSTAASAAAAVNNNSSGSNINNNMNNNSHNTTTVLQYEYDTDDDDVDDDDVEDAEEDASDYYDDAPGSSTSQSLQDMED